MSVSTSSAGGTINNCNEPCDCPPCPQVKSNNRSGQRIAKSSGGCNGSVPMTLKWNCGNEPVNSSLIRFSRCADDRKDAEWRCVPTFSFGTPVTNGSGCNSDCCSKAAAKAKAQAIQFAKASNPERREKTSLTWNEKNSGCPISCLNKCYEASKPYPKPNLPDQSLPDVTWSC
jgi:hypothetical protein